VNSAAIAGEGSIFKQMVRGSFWAILMRWSLRAVGLVSTMILARLLTPQDFGIVAMGSMVLGFLTLFSELGVDGFVIRSRDATRELCDTGWTIKIIQGAAIAILLAASGPLAVRYFHEPRLTPVFWVLAASAAISGFENIGMTLVRKDLDFARDFRFVVYKRLISFVVTLALAIALRSYWAIVIGTVLSAAIAVPLSFGMHPYRPRMRLARAREMLVFGASMLLMNMGRFLNERVDVLVVGRVASTAGMGTYNVASDLATMATSEIVAPVSRALYPAYARVAGDADMLKEVFLRSVSAMAFLCVPLGLGLCAMSEDAVRILLGNKWLAVVPLLQWLAIYSLLNSLIQATTYQVLIVVGRQWLGTALRWVRVAMLVPAVVLAAAFWGVVAVPIAATFVAAVSLPVTLYVVTRVLRLGAVDLIGCLWRPVTAALLMTLVVLELDPVVHSLFPRVITQVVAAAVTYIAAVFVLWWLSGRPRGVEETTYRAVSAALRGG
jgi:O-antigen/teichoic acid export membrane protein